MRNITVAIDDKTYRDIRIWCAVRDITVSRVDRTLLQDLPRLENVCRFPFRDAPAAGSLTFVTNAIAARIFLKERVDRRRWVAAIFVCCGVALLKH